VYPLISQACGARFVAVPTKQHRYDLLAILSVIQPETRLVFIANPNNPTGTYVTDADVRAFLKKVPKHVVVCFDEAYVDFVDTSDFPSLLSRAAEAGSRIVLLRTFSKSYGLAGLRIGYGIASRSMIGYLNRIRQPFNVNRLAQAAAAAALRDHAFIRKSKLTVQKGRQFLYDLFDEMNLPYVRSQANFVLVDVRRDARKVFRSLLKRGIIVRAMSAYGLKTFIRVSTGTIPELQKFKRALIEVFAQSNKRH
jgi:histidinol-phosphate aminotransferase